MPDPRPTDLIPVLRTHLEDVFIALDNARGYHLANDLATQYKNTGGVHRPSNLTKQIEKAHAKIAGYLEEDLDVPEE